MKKRYCVIFFASVLLFVFGALIYALSAISWGEPFSGQADEPYYLANTPIVIGDALDNQNNASQFETRVWLTTINGKLYFYSEVESSSPFSGHISVFDNGSAEPLYKIRGTFLAVRNNYIYYYRFAENDGLFNKAVYCYDVISGQEQFLLTSYRSKGQNLNPWNCYLDENGILYIPQDDIDCQYYPVVGPQVGDPIQKQVVYTYGLRTYVFSICNGPTLTGYDETGNTINYGDQLPPGLLNVIPCENGLLIHNQWYGDLLYYIVGNTGELVTLFTTPCERSYSAVNVYGNYAYFSVIRFKEFNTFATEYPNDTLNGTYRIDLRSLQIEKISSKAFRGLYIFDDSGIFACDGNGNIYKIDFDGNIVSTILEY